MRFIVGAALFSLIFSAATAQTFEETLSKAQAGVNDIAKYQQALQNPDARFQYAMVQEMLKLKDPALQRIAKEHALFSTNSVMREAAIKAVLDSGATLRIQMAGTGETYETITDFARVFGGTFINKRGEILIKPPAPVSDACWGTERHCVFRHVGTTLQYNPFYPGNYTQQVTSILNLGNDGVLRGTLTYKNTELVQVQIDLKE